jgi:hypothetical protein
MPLDVVSNTIAEKQRERPNKHVDLGLDETSQVNFLLLAPWVKVSAARSNAHHRVFKSRRSSCPRKLAERVGFEPTVPLRGHSLSRRAHSAALAPLRSLRSSRDVNREQVRKTAGSRLEAELTVRESFLQSPDERKRGSSFCIGRACWVKLCSRFNR